MELSDLVKKHVAYTHAVDIAEICKPLFEQCHLNYFDYAKVYFDDSVLSLLSDADWFHHYFTHKYPISSTVIEEGIHLWQNYLPEQCVKDLATDFGYHNGITIFNKTENFIEFVDFAAPSDHQGVIDYYFNHLDLLKDFVLYFKEKAGELINQANKQRFIIPNALRGDYLANKSYKEFQDLIKTQKIHLNFRSRNVILSKREYEVILQLAKGMTAKQAAGKLSISPRTVESHLENAKNKTSCNFKYELVEILRENLLSNLDER